MIILDSLDACGLISGDIDEQGAAPSTSDNLASNSVQQQQQQHDQTANDMNTSEPDMVLSVNQQLDSSMGLAGRDGIQSSGGSSNNNNVLIVDNRPNYQSRSAASAQSVDHASALTIASDGHNNHSQILASSWPGNANSYGPGAQAQSQAGYPNSLNAVPELIELVESHHHATTTTTTNCHYVEHGFDLQHQNHNNYDHDEHQFNHERQHLTNGHNVDEHMINGDSITLTSYNQQLFEPLVGSAANDQQQLYLDENHSSHSHSHHEHHHHHHAHLNSMMTTHHNHQGGSSMGHEHHHALVQDEVYWSDAVLYDNQHHQQHHFHHQQEQQLHNHNHRTSSNNNLCAHHQPYQTPSDEYNNNYNHQSYSHPGQHGHHNLHYQHNHNHYTTTTITVQNNNQNHQSSCLPESVIALNEHDSATTNSNNELLASSILLSNSDSQAGKTNQLETRSNLESIGHWADVDEENTHLLTLQPSLVVNHQQQPQTQTSATNVPPRQHKTVIRRQGDNINHDDDHDNDGGICPRESFSSIAELDEQLNSTTSNKPNQKKNGKSVTAASDRDDASSSGGSSTADERRSCSTATTCTSQAQANVVRQCDWVIGLGANHNINAKCNLSFNDLESFVGHLEEEHVKQDPVKRGHYFCRWSGCKRNESFNARYKLLVHMRVHSGEKPFECTKGPDCKKRFSRLENLKIHVRSHTGEKPYSCNYPNCTKSFTNSSDRIKHHKTHDNPKPYPCSEKGCEKRYTDPSSLRKHQKSHRRELLTTTAAAAPGTTTTTAPNQPELLTNTNNHGIMQDCRRHESITYDYVVGIDQQNQHHHQQQQQLQQPILLADYDPNCLLVQEQALPYHQHQHQLASSYGARPSYQTTTYNLEQQHQNPNPFVTGSVTTSYYSSDDHNNNHQMPNQDKLNQIDSQLSQTWAGPATSHQVASSQINYNNNNNNNNYHGPTMTSNYNNQSSTSYEDHQQDNYASNKGQQHQVNYQQQQEQHDQQQYNENHQSYNNHQSRAYESQYSGHGSSRGSNTSLLQMQHQQLMRSLPPPSSETRKYASQHQHFQQHQQQRR